MAALDGPSRQSIAPRPSSPSSLAKSGLNLNKYSTLPPIRVSMDSAKSVDATAKRGTTSSSAQTSSTRRASTKGGAGGDFDVIEVPVAPETEKLYVTVVATTRPADEYRNIFDGSERFFFNARQVEMASSQDMVRRGVEGYIWYYITRSLHNPQSDLSGDCVTDIRNVLLDAVDDIVCELEAENFVGALTNSDVPIFQHLSQRPSDYAVFDRDDVDNTTSTDFLAK